MKHMKSENQKIIDKLQKEIKSLKDINDSAIKMIESYKEDSDQLKSLKDKIIIDFFLNQEVNREIIRSKFKQDKYEELTKAEIAKFGAEFVKGVSQSIVAYTKTKEDKIPPPATTKNNKNEPITNFNEK